MTSTVERQHSGSGSRWWSLSIVSLGTFMVTMDIGLLSIALPTIITELRADIALAGWITLIYALVTASLYLPCGRLSDILGRSKVYRLGFLFYAVTALIAGFAQEGWQLIFFRGLQAVGSALIMTNSFAMITTLFPPAERGRAMGMAGGTVSALGYTLGPVIGGLLTYALGWRANFFVTAVLSFIGFAAAGFLLRGDVGDPARGARQEPFDFIGAVSSALGIAMLLLALTGGQNGDWQSAFVAAQVFAGVVSLVFFVWWEGRARSPLLDLRLFRIRAFSYGNIARMISFIAISMASLMMPFFLQLAMGMDPLQAGLLVAPISLGLALLAPVSGWLSERISAQLLCALGLGVKGIGFTILSFLSVQSSSLDVILRLGLVGLGLGIFQTPNNNSLMSAIPKERLGVGSSFLSIVRSLGNSTGAALATTIVSARLLALTGQTSLADLRGSAGTQGAAVLQAFLEGFHYTFLSAAVLCFLGAVISAFLISEERR
jgi:EmrB/QacA subfamily drug resistance transporter